MADLRTAILALRAAMASDRWRRLGLKSSLAFCRFVELYRKYSENQPRDELGRWTDGADGDDENVEADIPTGSIVTLQKNPTGDAQIDAYTDELEKSAKIAIERLGPGTGQYYGQRVHEEFAEAVRNAGLPGIAVEFGWREAQPSSGYSSGSIRTDVVLRTELGEVLAIWDLKTGTAYLSRSRVDQIRDQVGIGIEIPIYELHVTRGTRRKSLTETEYRFDV